MQYLSSLDSLPASVTGFPGLPWPLSHCVLVDDFNTIQGNPNEFTAHLPSKSKMGFQIQNEMTFGLTVTLFPLPLLPVM